MIGHLDNGAANNYDFCMCPRIAGGLNEAALSLKQGYLLPIAVTGGIVQYYKLTAAFF